MSVQGKTPLEIFLDRHDDGDWSRVVGELLPSIHEVDRNATRVWFAFFPLALLRALEAAEDPAALAQKLLLQGEYYLKNQIDSSHTFLYGHRFWKRTKRVVTELASDQSAPAPNTTLPALVRDVAARVAEHKRVDASLTLGIAAVALMTLQQVGLEAFGAARGVMFIDERHAHRSPEQVLRERAKDDGQGLFGFLRTTDKRWTVTFDENDSTARFKMFQGQEIASAAPTHPRKDWPEVDPRCTVGEGPIPVQCRSASCGTCWVGVLGGAEKLSPVDERERRVMQQLGYVDTDEPRPLIRLSCQAQGFGAVSVVIPPWNGVFGKYLRRLKDGGSGGGAEDAVEAEANA